MIFNRIDAITGLRGLAALLVVYAHLTDFGFYAHNPLFPGEIGVMIFFSLSGFLMSFLYLEKKLTPPAVINYVISRVSRIAPAYLVAIIISLIIYTQFDNNFPYKISGNNILRHLLFLGNESVFWSITPEVQFYFIFLVIWIAIHSFIVRSNLIGGLFLILIFLVVISCRDFLPGTFVGSKLHYFLFGCIAGTLREKNKSTSKYGISIEFLHASFLCLAFICIFGLVDISFASKNKFYDSILAAFYSSFFVFIFSYPSRLGKLIFENKFLTYCGDWSFSIYLLNIPIIYWMQKYPHKNNESFPALFIVVIIIISSWINFKLIEMPGARFIKYCGGKISPIILLILGRYSKKKDKKIPEFN
jgi:peptidoglycan/LPS O-acetylase OafA/YrhL